MPSLTTKNKTIIASTICKTGERGKFMFEKSLIGAYCSRLYCITSGKGISPFHATAELKQTDKMQDSDKMQIEKKGRKCTDKR